MIHDPMQRMTNLQFGITDLDFTHRHALAEEGVGRVEELRRGGRSMRLRFTARK